jgi:hypothetical protein
MRHFLFVRFTVLSDSYISYSFVNVELHFVDPGHVLNLPRKVYFVVGHEWIAYHGFSCR